MLDVWQEAGSRNCAKRLCQANKNPPRLIDETAYSRKAPSAGGMWRLLNVANYILSPEVCIFCSALQSTF